MESRNQSEEGDRQVGRKYRKRAEKLFQRKDKVIRPNDMVTNSFLPKIKLEEDFGGGDEVVVKVEQEVVNVDFEDVVKVEPAEVVNVNFEDVVKVEPEEEEMGICIDDCFSLSGENSFGSASVVWMPTMDQRQTTSLDCNRITVIGRNVSADSRRSNSLIPAEEENEPEVEPESEPRPPLLEAMEEIQGSVVEVPEDSTPPVLYPSVNVPDPAIVGQKLKSTRMASSNVLISGLGGLGVEIAKNVILDGVQSVNLQDTKNNYQIPPDLIKLAQGKAENNESGFVNLGLPVLSDWGPLSFCIEREFKKLEKQNNNVVVCDEGERGWGEVQGEENVVQEVVVTERVAVHVRSEKERSMQNMLENVSTPQSPRLGSKSSGSNAPVDEIAIDSPDVSKRSRGGGKKSGKVEDDPSMTAPNFEKSVDDWKDNMWTDLKNYVGKLKKQIELKDKMLEEEKVRVRGLQDKLKELRNQFSSDKSKFAGVRRSLEEQVQVRSVEVAGLKSSLSRLENENAQLRNNVNALEGDIKGIGEVNSKYEEVRKSEVGLKGEVSKLKSRLSGVNEVVREKDSRILELTREVRGLESALVADDAVMEGEVNAKESKWVSQMAEKDREIERLKQQLGSSVEELQRKRQELKDKAKGVDQMEELRNTNEHLRSSLESSKQRCDELSSKLSEHLEESQANNTRQQSTTTATNGIITANGSLSDLQAAQVLVGTIDTQGGPNTVLRVIIKQEVYPVTLNMLYQIFSRLGTVLRIFTYTKNEILHALIQYSDVVMAQTAKLCLDGKNIYNGCCTLRIEYSKLASLDGLQSRDYTNPTLPTSKYPQQPHFR